MAEAKVPRWFTADLVAEVQRRSDAGETMRQIADSLERTLPSLLRAANLAGVRVRRKWQQPAPEVKAALGLIRQGVPPGEAAKIAGASPNAVRSASFRRGMARRKMTDAEVREAHAAILRDGVEATAERLRRHPATLRDALKKRGLSVLSDERRAALKAERTARLMAFMPTAEEKSRLSRAVHARRTPEQRSASARRASLARLIRNVQLDNRRDRFAERWEREVRKLVRTLRIPREVAEERACAFLLRRIPA